MTITFSALLLYAGALCILFFTPGPVWLALIARALSGGFRSAVPLALGVAVGDVLWPLIAVLGISWILSVFDTFMIVLKWVACGVFILMGWMLIKHAKVAINTDSRLTRPGFVPGFLAGITVILGNPKAVLFYLGVLPGFFDLRAMTVWDVVVICFISLLVPLLGNLCMAALISRARGFVSNPNTFTRINIFCGILLIGVGLVIPLI